MSEYFKLRYWLTECGPCPAGQITALEVCVCARARACVRACVRALFMYGGRPEKFEIYVRWNLIISY